MKPMLSVLILVSTLFAPTLFAKTLTEEQWQGLVQKTLYEGEVSKANFGTVVMISRQKQLPDGRVLKVYFSILGSETATSYVLRNMSLVSELVSTKDGKTETLQWSYLFSPTGELEDLWNRKFTKNAVGGLSMEELPTKDLSGDVIDQQILKSLQYFSNEGSQ